MKKILITLFCVLLLISCNHKWEETTYIVKFKDDSQMEIIGHHSRISNKHFYIRSNDSSYTFNRDEILYIIKK